MLPDWINPERALHRLERIIAKKGLIDEANAALDSKGRVATHLPGFTIFDRGELVSPYEWCVPRPRSDESDVLNAYEGYVDRNLGLVPNPGLAAHPAIGRGLGRKYFGPRRSAGRWRMPLVRLLAVAQHVSDGPARIGRDGDRVEIDVVGAKLLVTSRGAWSNFHGKMVVAKRPAVDGGLDEVTVQPIKTAHPLAAFLEGRVEDDVLWLANVVIQGERAGLLQPVRFVPPAARAIPKRRRALAAEIVGAGMACQELLTGAPQGLILALYQAAVPVLMTSRYFKSHFGNPYGPYADRFVSLATRAEWATKIDKIVEDLQRK
jgi:hypothetical protein